MNAALQTNSELKDVEIQVVPEKISVEVQTEQFEEEVEVNTLALVPIANNLHESNLTLTVIRDCLVQWTQIPVVIKQKEEESCQEKNGNSQIPVLIRHKEEENCQEKNKNSQENKSINPKSNLILKVGLSYVPNFRL